MNPILTNHCKETFKRKGWGFPGGSVVKNPPANAGDMDLIPGPRRSPICHGRIRPDTTAIEPGL